MINRFAFAALEGILCHFPGGRGRISGRKSYGKRKVMEVKLGECILLKKKRKRETVQGSKEMR